MKNVTQMFCRAISVLFLVCCLFSIAVPVSAAQADTTPSDTSYGIDIICRYSDVDESDSIDPSIYEKNVFLLSSKDSGLYAVAEYCEETQSYQVVNYTNDISQATKLCCNAEAKLHIGNLAPGTYLLEHLKTLTGYVSITDTELVLSSENVFIDGTKQNVYTDPNTGEISVSLSLLLHQGFQLPDVCGGCQMRTAICFASVFLVAGTILIAFVILKERNTKATATSCMPPLGDHSEYNSKQT